MNYVKSDMSKGEKYTNKLHRYEYDADLGTFRDTYNTEHTIKYDNAFVAGVKVKALKNVTLTGEYVHTNADIDNVSQEALLEYKGSNLQDPGSFGVYARYFKFGKNGGNPDDLWGSRPAGSKGWMLGFKYVPAKNVEWHTLYSPQKKNFGKDGEYTRNLFRTEVDFHF